MVLEPPLLDAPAEEHAAVSAPMAASAAVARSERGRWSKRIVQSSPAVGAPFLHYFAGDAKQLGCQTTSRRHAVRRRYPAVPAEASGSSSASAVVGRPYGLPRSTTLTGWQCLHLPEP